MSALKHIFANEGIIGHLLEAWADAVLRYDKLWGGEDCCWWYNERANVSVLAGAAWSNGWVALEEYATRKLAPVSSEIGTDGPGRVDLYISTDVEHFAFEAKLVWQALDKFAEGLDCNAVVSDGMRQAKLAALQLRDEAGAHFAATFVVPFFGNSSVDQPNSLYQQLQIITWLANLRTDLDQPEFHSSELADSRDISWAYVFPRIDQYCYVNERGNNYPGVVLILERVV